MGSIVVIVLAVAAVVAIVYGRSEARRLRQETPARPGHVDYVEN